MNDSLIESARKRDLSGVEDALLTGANVNAMSLDGWIALHYASNDGHIDVVEILLNHTTNIDIVTKEGLTPVMLAARNGHKDVISILIERGANLNVVNSDGWLALHYASDNGHTDVVEILLNHTTNIDIVTKEGLTPVMLAARNGHKDVISILIQRGANLNVVNSDGWLALHYASDNGHTDVVEILLNHTTNIDIVTEGGLTPVMLAASMGHKDVISILIQRGANLNVVNPDGWLALHYASAGRHTNVVEVLLNHTTNIDIVTKDGLTPVMIAASMGHKDVISILIERGANLNLVDPDGWLALHYASDNGHTDVVEILLNHTTNIDIVTKDGLTPVMIAASMGHKDVISILIQRGANLNLVDPGGWLALHYASDNGHTDVVEILLNHTTNIDIVTKGGLTPVMLAASMGHKDVISILIQRGANLNVVNPNGGMALHYASDNGHTDVVEILLNHTTNIDIVTKGGLTPVMIAASMGHKDVISILIQRGANLNLVDPNGGIALHYASDNGHTDVVEILLNHTTNIDIVTKKGSSPLMLAARNGHKDVISILIERGANLNVVNPDGNTPLMLACQEGHQSVAMILLEKGADRQLLNKNGETALTLAKKKAEDFHQKLLQQIDHINESILLQALEEGYVILSIIKLLLAGPPAVGKSSFKHLLFDWEPPHHHHSTPIADRPIRAVERIAKLDGAKSWEMVDTKELMQMLAEDICVQASINPMETTQHSQPSIIKKEAPSSIIENVNGKETLHSDTPNHTMSSKPPSLMSGETQCTTPLAVPSQNDKKSTTKPKIENQNEDALSKQSNHSSLRRENVVEVVDSSVKPSNGSQSVESDTVVKKTVKKKNVLQLSNNILTAMKGVASRQLSQSTWIYVLDSGGQPQFADVSRAFVRGNTVIVLVHKLTDQLSSKPIFQYSINGKPLTQPNELRMTNLQLITTYVRSISSAKVAAVDGGDKEALPTFLIIGTYEDKMRGLGKLRHESLKKKNAQLIAALQQYKDQLIFYNESKQELIFPVDNMCVKNRQNLSSLVRKYIMGNNKAVIEKKVPIRWYVFESNIKEEGEKNDLGIVSQSQYQEIGQTLGMTETQIKGAITFFKSLSVFLHFNTSSRLIFTNPQYFLDALSNIIRISFVDFPQELLQKGKILPPNVHRRLQEEGLFTIDLLDLISIEFAPDLFEKNDLLRLLCDLCIVSEVHREESSYYFIPTALSPKHLTTSEKETFAEICEPLVLSFEQGVVPQGLFPATVVALLNRKESPFFTLDGLTAQFPRQLRFAVKLQSFEPRGALLLVDTMLWMEIYWTGDPTECSTLHSLVTTAINFCAKPLAYHSSALKCKPGTLCNLKHHDQPDMPPVHVALVTVNKRKEVKLSCTIQDLLPVEFNKKFRPWMEGFENEYFNKGSHNTSDTECSQIVLQPLLSKIEDNKPEKHVLLRFLSSVSAKWQEIGELLGVDSNTIQGLCHSCDSDEVKMSKMLQSWFDNKPTPVTWGNIISILNGPLQKKSLAIEICQFLVKESDDPDTSTS